MRDRNAIYSDRFRRRVARMGITEVVRHAPYIYQQFQRLKRAVVAERPYRWGIG